MHDSITNLSSLAISSSVPVVDTPLDKYFLNEVSELESSLADSTAWLTLLCAMRDRWY